MSFIWPSIPKCEHEYLARLAETIQSKAARAGLSTAAWLASSPLTTAKAPTSPDSNQSQTRPCRMRAGQLDRRPHRLQPSLQTWRLEQYTNSNGTKAPSKRFSSRSSRYAPTFRPFRVQGQRRRQTRPPRCRNCTPHPSWILNMSHPQ